MDHRTNTLKHASPPRDEAIEHPSDRNLGNDPKTGRTNRAPCIDELNGASDTLKMMKGMTVGARTLGHAADILTEIWKNKKDITVVLSMSGAASMGQLDLIIAEMIDRGLVDAIVCTGAIVTHAVSLEMGGKQFQIDPEIVDEKVDTGLYNRGYNRVFDTVELENSLEKTGDLVVSILKEWPEDKITSWELHNAIGHQLHEKFSKEDGILHAAYRSDIPVIVPAFTDSEIGLSFARYLIEGAPIHFDSFGDLERYTELACDSKSLAILTLGGGVPRNWAQQVAPFIDTLIDRDLIERKTPVRFKYGIRICPEFTEWGGLSGCTYSEGISWGKFTPTSEGGQFAEVYSDYTTVFPFLIKGVFERLGLD